LRQALLAIFTLPGIPVVYYGTEQGFRTPRAAMFARGFGSGGRDHFDAEAPLYRYLRRLADLRRAFPALSRGRPRVLDSNRAAAGALLWTMREGQATLLVAFNSAEHPVLLAGVATGWPAGTRLRPRFAIEGDAEEIVIGAGGQLTRVLAPRGGWVWSVEPGASGPAAAASPHAAPVLEPLPAAPVTGSLPVRGRAAPGAALQLVVDGNLARARSLRADAQGVWRAVLDTADHVDAAIEHRLVAWDAERGRASAPQRFTVARRWQPRARHEDPPGDDRGPAGAYLYPTDPLWRHRPADLRRVEVETSGGALRLRVRLASLLASWNPPNGFDHVALTLFLELPHRAGGARVMPGQHGELPGNMRWHYRLRLGGWSNALFAAPGATATHEGTPLAASAALTLVRERNELQLTLPASALGDPGDWRGARLYLTTWDYDGGYRTLAPLPGPFVFGGGDDAGVRSMDDSGVLTLR
jgi:hypothetical protein